MARLVAPLFAGALAAGYLLRAAAPNPSLSQTEAGLLLVALAVLLSAAVVHGRGRLEQYLKGALGEEAVARELAFLPAGFDVIHGLHLPAVSGGRPVECDHVVAGPTGLYLVETKNWSGSVSVRNGRVLYDGRAPTRPPLAQVQAAARACAAWLAREAGIRVEVQPVLVFASPGLDLPRSGSEGVVICTLPALRGLLVEPPVDAPDAAGIAGAAAALRRLALGAAAAETGPKAAP